MTQLPEILQKLPEGVATFLEVNNLSCFIINEDESYLKRIPQNPQIAIKTGMFDVDNIPVVCVLFLVNNNYNMLYETWWNYCAKGSDKHFEALTKQDHLYFHFCNRGEKKRTIQTANNIRQTFEVYINSIMQKEVWSMSEFDEAREKLYQKYDSPEKIWNSL